MTATLPQARREPHVLLLTADDRDDAIDLKRTFAKAIRRMQLAAFGVFISPVGSAWGVYLGTHDGSEVAPDEAAIRAATLRGMRPGQ